MVLDPEPELELELDPEPALGVAAEVPGPEEGVASARTWCAWTRRTEGRIARFSPCMRCGVCVWEEGVTVTGSYERRVWEGEEGALRRRGWVLCRGRGALGEVR